MELWRETGHIALIIRKSQASVFSLLSALGVCMYWMQTQWTAVCAVIGPADTHPHTAPNPPAWHTQTTPHLPYAFLREPVPHQDCYYITFD